VSVSKVGGKAVSLEGELRGNRKLLRKEAVMKTLITPPLSEEQQALAHRIHERLQERLAEEMHALTEMLASREYGKLLGPTEYEVRDIVHRLGAFAIETALLERKKGDTQAAATPVPTATKRPSSNAGKAKPM
jgi:hypothetical protein